MSIVLLRNTTRPLTLKHAPRSLIASALPASSIKRGIRPFSTTLPFRKDSDDRRKAYNKKYDDDKKGGEWKDYKNKYQEDEKKGSVWKHYKKKDSDAEKGGARKSESLANAEPVPWHYEDVSTSPVDKQDKPSVREKGKLLSTPSRLFKLLLPLKNINNSKQNGRPVEPLALLVHPRQPLSYLERLIQSELPPVHPENGGPARPPEIAFKAVNVGDALMSERDSEGNASKAEKFLRGGEGEGGVETGGGLGKLSTEPKSGDGGLVRWSTSTELGDFVRDAARGKEFVIEVEKNESVSVGVPSFHQRTHYQRQKLMEITRKIAAEGKLKDECDKLAHRGAQRVAMGGFAVLMGWWGGVCWLTFATPLGWDFMEPVTYLAGIFLVILGYGWFLYYRREVSYRSLLHITVNSRQMKLYTQRGFDIDRWEELVSDARSLRREIKHIADQYDVKWDERNDEAGGEKVLKVLKEAEEKSKKNSEDDGDEEEDVVEMREEKKDLKDL